MFAHLSVPSFILFFFSSPFFSVDPFQVVNYLLFHSCCNFLHPPSCTFMIQSSEKLKKNLQSLT